MTADKDGKTLQGYGSGIRRYGDTPHVYNPISIINDIEIDRRKFKDEETYRAEVRRLHDINKKECDIEPNDRRRSKASYDDVKLGDYNTYHTEDEFLHIQAI